MLTIVTANIFQQKPILANIFHYKINNQTIPTQELRLIFASVYIIGDIQCL